MILCGLRWLLIVCVLLTPVPGGCVSLVAEAQIEAALATSEAKAWHEAIARLQAGQPANPSEAAEALANLSLRLRDDGALDELARAALLHSLLPALREAPSTPASVQALEALSRYRHDFALRGQEGSPQSRPVFPVATQAAAALRWQDGRAAAQRALAGGPAPDGADPAWRAGVHAALSQASPAALAGVCQQDSAGPWLALCARTLKSPKLYAKLFTSNEPDGAALSEARASLEGSSAETVLKLAAVNPALRAAAYYQLAELPGGVSFLLEQLGKPEVGELAAAALAKRADPQVMEALRQRLHSPDVQVQRQAILALKLRGDQPARAALKQFTQDPAQAAALRQELRLWLGQ